jgi:hypothetical protein
MEHKHEKRHVERRIIYSGDRSSGDSADFWIQLPPVENVVSIEFNSAKGSVFEVAGQQIAIQLEGWGENRHSKGFAYWRTIDTESNTRYHPDWELFPNKEVKKLNTLHFQLYKVNPGVPMPAEEIAGEWTIELDFYCAR